MPERPASASRATTSSSAAADLSCRGMGSGLAVIAASRNTGRLSRFPTRGLGDALLLGDEGLGLGGVEHGVGRDLVVEHGRQRLVHVVAAVLAVADAAVKGVVAAPEPEPARLLGDRLGDEARIERPG